MPSRHDVNTVLDTLRARATKRTQEGMSRFGLPSDNAWGVSVADIRRTAKELGRDHALARSLWASGVYEARMLAAFVDEPERVTVAQMDRWCRDFDNWGICDTVCFSLFDRTPHAFGRVEAWANRDEEFVKRAAFALLASLAAHDKRANTSAFEACLPAIERGAFDERNFVKKGVSWALRSVGRRKPELHASALQLAQRLAAASHPGARWVGKDALRDLSKHREPRRRAPRVKKDEVAR